MCGASQEFWPDAVVVSTVIDAFESLPAFLELSEEEREDIFREGGSLRNYPQYFKVHDALMAVAQTSERVCTYKQRMRLRDALFTGEPEVRFMDQAEFGGRLKMFGAAPPAEVAEAITAIRGKPNRGFEF